MSEYRNCVECGQARDARFVDEEGVCSRCNLPVILLASNPLFEAGGN